MASAVPPGDFTKRKLARIAEGALVGAGVAGVFPTPIEEVQRHLGIRERVPVHDLPNAVEAKKPRWVTRVLGAYVRSERVVFIDANQATSRVLFTDAHEAIHAACEWHEEPLYWDGEDELFRERRDQIEGEANYGAGHLIFQGGRFHGVALKDEVSLSTPLSLAASFGASRVATAHYYAEEHPDPVALLVLGRYPDLGLGSYPIWRSVESISFRQRYGEFGARYPAGVAFGEGPDAPFAEILQACRLSTHPPKIGVELGDLSGRAHPFVAEAFFNQHVQLVFVAERHRVRAGRRVRLAS